MSVCSIRGLLRPLRSCNDTLDLRVPISRALELNGDPMNLIRHFETQIANGHKICVMPISRVLIEEYIVDPIPGYVLCPPGSVDFASWRCVWDPASAWENGEIHLGWAKAAFTQVSKEGLPRFPRYASRASIS